jgi:hypothetical protein
MPINSVVTGAQLIPPAGTTTLKSTMNALTGTAATNTNFTLDPGTGYANPLPAPVDAKGNLYNIYYFNYNSVLAANTSSDALFTDVIIPANWDQTQVAEMGDFNIVVTAQAIQSDTFSSEADALNALNIAQPNPMDNTTITDMGPTATPTPTDSPTPTPG